MANLHHAFGEAFAHNAPDAATRKVVFALFFATCDEAGLLRNPRTGKAQALGVSVLTGSAELKVGHPPTCRAPSLLADQLFLPLLCLTYLVGAWQG